MAQRTVHDQGAQAGFSLIELMISMVIGMVVVGAVMATYLSSGSGSRASQALSQATEDASLALNVLRASVSMVGYGNPTGVDGGGNFTKLYLGKGLRGCDQAFSNPEAAAIEALACIDGDSGGPDAIAVAFEADALNSVTNGAGVPLDCLGNGLADAGGYFLNYARFYVLANTLFCRGSVNADALVENVADLQIRYGVAEALTPNQASNYMTADQMNFDALATDQFDRVVSVRMCVLIFSTDEVMDAPMTYLDCNGNSTTAGDKRLYRSFTTTVVLQNRLGEML